MCRYTYATGYKTREDAEAAIVDLINEGEISEGERPQVIAYDAWTSPLRNQPVQIVPRFAITLSE